MAQTVEVLPESLPLFGGDAEFEQLRVQVHGIHEEEFVQRKVLSKEDLLGGNREQREEEGGRK